MWKIILGSFVFFVLVFYALSGGPYFTPPPQTQQRDAVLKIYDIDLAAVAAQKERAQRLTDAAEVEAALTLALIAEAAQSQNEKDMRRITATRVNVREGPSTDFAVAAQLRQGTVVEVLEISDTNWAKLHLDGGRTGWMAARFLEGLEGGE